jgi:hypothetical protein
MGKPTASAVPSHEFIVREEQTQGTETSKYLQEYKSTEIPIVVASEIGLAQTWGVSPWGLWGSQHVAGRLAEGSGKGHHSG